MARASLTLACLVARLRRIRRLRKEPKRSAVKRTGASERLHLSCLELVVHRAMLESCLVLVIHRATLESCQQLESLLHCAMVAHKNMSCIVVCRVLAVPCELRTVS